MRIGPYRFDDPVFLAPMAGITDKPFRMLCRTLGAGHAISEMVGSRPELRDSAKSRSRIDHRGERGPVHVQIAGSDPDQMADAARYNVDLGADLIDINMGCPAKKVCSKLAGSSLLRDEALVAAILERVAHAVSVPVTLKTRTGWDADCRNIVSVGRIAESVGIAAITLHGRTRNDFYHGSAEHDSLRRLRDAVSLPLVANGDIRSAGEARAVLAQTGADAVMIGRAARSRPWLPGRIAAVLAGRDDPGEPEPIRKRDILRRLVAAQHAFYGEERGVRMARKHIGWQLEAFAPGAEERRIILKAAHAREQLALLDEFFERRIQLSQAA